MIPKEIKKWQSNEYFYLDDIDKNLTYHLYLQYKGITHEIFRETIKGEKYYAWNVWGLYSNLAGWRVDKNNWFTDKEDMQRVEWDCHPDLPIAHHFYNKRKLSRYFKTLKYVYPMWYSDRKEVWHDDKSNLFEWIKMLYKYPEMEFVYKNDYIRHLWHDKRLYNMSKDTKKAFYRYVTAYGSTMWAYTFNEILWCSKQLYVNRTEKKYKEYLENNYWESRFSVSGSYFRKRYAKLIKRYGKKWVRDEYKDYWGAAKKLGIKQKYPRDLIKAHDSTMNSLALTTETKKLLKKKVYDKYSRVINTINNTTYSYQNKLSLKLPKIKGDLVVLGRELDNCVGTYDYDEKMRDGESIILSVNNNNTPIACCEIDTINWRISQLYGKHNSPDGMEKPRVLVNRFIREVRV